MMLVLIAQHNVHGQPIIQILLMIGLMAFNGFGHKSEKHNLLMVIMQFELSEKLHNLIRVTGAGDGSWWTTIITTTY